jgi:hypothetical protein
MMKKYSVLFVAVLGFSAMSLQTAKAGDVEKTVYVIENNHPVKRKLFVDAQGHYYRVEGGKHVIVEHVSERYPEKYFTRDGKPRPGITIDF